MKKYIFVAFAIFNMTAFSAFSQVSVVGAGSSLNSDQSGSESDRYINIGGPSLSDYDNICNGLYECIYRYTIATQNKAGEPVMENYSTILQIGDNAGRFTDYSVYRRDSVPFSDNPDNSLWSKLNLENKKVEYKFTGDILLDYPINQLTYTDLVSPYYQEYTETYPVMEWVIGDEQDTICGYLCTKATGSYGGRNWDVWFTEDIPSQMGPWKFSGLPGLIMKASDSEGIHDFTAISFRESHIPIAKPHNPLIQKTTRGKFIDLKKRFEKDPFSTISPEAISEITVEKGGGFILNKVEVPRRPNGYTPIEIR